MTKETYYAIRIGSPKLHSPYFMVRRSRGSEPMTPWLFANRDDAERHCPKQPHTKVVKVRVIHP